MSVFPHLPEIRHLASTLGIQNMPEEADHQSSAEGQFPAALLSHTQWAGEAGARRKLEVGPIPSGECLV